MISMTAEYALRAVVFLGSQNGQPAKTHRIATGIQAPPAYMMKVLGSLRRAGLVKARRGRCGGVELARPLNDLTILDVINASRSLERTHRSSDEPPACADALRRLDRRLADGIALMETLFKETTMDQFLTEEGANQDPRARSRSEGPEFRGLDGPGPDLARSDTFRVPGARATGQAPCAGARSTHARIASMTWPWTSVSRRSIPLWR